MAAARNFADMLSRWAMLTETPAAENLDILESKFRLARTPAVA